LGNFHIVGQLSGFRVRPAQPFTYARHDRSLDHEREHPVHGLRQGIHQDGSPAGQLYQHAQEAADASVWLCRHQPQALRGRPSIPLSIGGNPQDPRNLWPEPRISEWNAAKKDTLEYTLYRMVCDGEITLKEAQNEVASNWIEARKRYVHGKTRHGYRRVD